jgi:uncharacterized membrane protein
VIVILPVFAPIFMALGWKTAGKAIYTLYSYLCHQLPERSYFLFGSKFMYSLNEIHSAWQTTFDPLILRQFIGNPGMGWKIAWSDRMISLYGGIWLIGIIWWNFRNRFGKCSFSRFMLLTLPMVIDGTSHLISDLGGIGQGFRDSNEWLRTITQNLYKPTFYMGDAWGSFNASMRLISGILFALGVVWFCYPMIEEIIQQRRFIRIVAPGNAEALLQEKIEI